MKTPQAPRRSNRKKQTKLENSKNICIPIPSKTLVKPNSVQEESLKLTTKHFNLYKEQLSHFSQSQTQNLLILRIATSSNIPLHFFTLPLHRLLTQASSEMMMNDIEIVLWSIYLDRFVWKEGVGHTKLLMYITAFAVKSYMSSQLEPFSAYLTFKFAHFSAYFNKWLQNSRSRLAASPRELNKKFVYLCRRIQNDEVKLINCNFIVDDILEMAPPYSQEKNKKIESQSSSLQSSFIDKTLPCSGIAIQDIEGKDVQSEDECLPPPVIVRLDSVFAYPFKQSETPNGDISANGIELNNSWMLENLESSKMVIEDSLPQLSEQTSFFTYYMSQSHN